MNLDKMNVASHLLPDPGGEVVRSLITEIFRLKNIIYDVVHIVDPTCPDSEAYIDGHCSLSEIVKRKISPQLDIPIISINSTSIITKQSLCREMILNFCKTEGINESDLNDKCCYLSSTVGISMEVLGLIQTDDAKQYISSRSGIVAVSNMRFGTTPKFHTLREVLNHLPDEGDL